MEASDISRPDPQRVSKSSKLSDGKSPQHESYHGNINHIVTCANLIFRVFTLSSIPIQPSKCPFHHPSFWDYFKFCHLILICHYFKPPATDILAPSHYLSPSRSSAQINVNPVAVTATLGGTHLALSSIRIWSVRSLD